MLGSDALTLIRASLSSRLEEMTAWETVSRSTDFREAGDNQ